MARLVTMSGNYAPESMSGLLAFLPFIGDAAQKGGGWFMDNVRAKARASVQVTNYTPYYVFGAVATAGLITFAVTNK